MRVHIVLALAVVLCIGLGKADEVGERTVVPAAKLVEPSFLEEPVDMIRNEANVMKGKTVCARNIPNVRGILRRTCCYNMQCPFTNGICCEGRSHCCPYGTVCVQGDDGTPPGCLHVLGEIYRQVMEKERKKGSAPPHVVEPKPDPNAKVPAVATQARFQQTPPQPTATIPYPQFRQKLNAKAQTASLQPKLTSAQPRSLADDGNPEVIRNPKALRCPGAALVGCPKPIKLNKIVYEDAMAPQERDAFSQYRVKKTTEHHAAIAKGGKAVNNFVLQRTIADAQKPIPDPPIPPTLVTQVPGIEHLIGKPKGVIDPASAGLNCKGKLCNFGQLPKELKDGSQGLYHFPDPLTGKLAPWKVVYKLKNEAKDASVVRTDTPAVNAKMSPRYVPSGPKAFVEEAAHEEKAQKVYTEKLMTAPVFKKSK